MPRRHEHHRHDPGRHHVRRWRPGLHGERRTVTCRWPAAWQRCEREPPDPGDRARRARRPAAHDDRRGHQQRGRCGPAQAHRAHTTVGPSADLSVTQSGDAEATAGQDATLTITVSNAGPSPRDERPRHDQLPPGRCTVERRPPAARRARFAARSSHARCRRSRWPVGDVHDHRRRTRRHGRRPLHEPHLGRVVDARSGPGERLQWPRHGRDRAPVPDAPGHPTGGATATPAPSARRRPRRLRERRPRPSSPARR